LTQRPLPYLILALSREVLVPLRPPLLLRLLTFALPLAFACGRAPAPRQRPPPAVTSAEVTVRDVPVEIRAPIDLRPLQQADVGAKAIGWLDAVLVDRGDRVKRGQLLAVVRPSDLPDQLSSARGTLAQLQAQVALARASFERGQRLAPTGFVSEQELQQQRTAVESAEAALSAAQSNVGALATRLGETRIESPLDGWVSARRLDPGALVGPSAGSGAILTIQRVDVLRAFVPVNERDVARLRTGLDAHLTLDALPGRTIAGKVVRVSPSLDPTSRTVDAEVQVQNADGLLRPGMYGRAAIVIEVRPQAVVVPVTAVQLTGGTFHAFVVGPPEPDPAAHGGGAAKPGGQKEGRGAGEDGAGPPPGTVARVKRVALEIGVDGGDWLEVTRGLAPGDEIVTAGIDVLSDGSLVRAVKGVDPFTGRPVVEAAAHGRP
jgi:HlyD family secretion protein/macrolide-specific efflux system membrane fusion protein